MPWSDSGIYGGCCTGLKHRIFAQNCRERGWFEKMMIPSLWLLVIIISENDDHKKSPNSELHGFLWSSFSYTYIHKDDHKKSPNSQFHGFLWSSFSYIYIRMIIRSHRNWPVASYDHHFHKSPPFPAILSKNSGFEACTASPIYARITPGHQLKRSLLATSNESRITLLI